MSTDKSDSETVLAMTTERMLEAYAKSLAVYYASEKAFMADPTPINLQRHIAALDRHATLREEVRYQLRIASAIGNTEVDETVGR